MTREEAQELVSQYTDEWCTVSNDTSCLDGNFTADELRKIAEVMDRIS